MTVEIPARARPDGNLVTISAVKFGETALTSANTPYAASDHSVDGRALCTAHRRVTTTVPNARVGCSPRSWCA